MDRHGLRRLVAVTDLRTLSLTPCGQRHRVTKLRRAVIARGLALMPALAVVQWLAGTHSTPLLMGSQVVSRLSLQFALLLLVFASR